MYDIYVFSSMLYVVFFATVIIFLLTSIRENGCQCHCCSKKESEPAEKNEPTQKTSVEEPSDKKDTEPLKVEPTENSPKKGRKKSKKPTVKPTDRPKVKKPKIKESDIPETVPTVEPTQAQPLKEEDIKKTLIKNGSIHIFYDHKSSERNKQEVTLYDGKARLIETITCTTEHLKKLNVLTTTLLETLRVIPEIYKKESVIKINTNSIELLRKWTTIKINHKNGVLEDTQWAEVLDSIKEYEIILAKTKKVA